MERQTRALDVVTHLLLGVVVFLRNVWDRSPLLRDFWKLDSTQTARMMYWIVTKQQIAILMNGYIPIATTPTGMCDFCYTPGNDEFHGCWARAWIAIEKKEILRVSWTSIQWSVRSRTAKTLMTSHSFLLLIPHAKGVQRSRRDWCLCYLLLKSFLY
jgi:hypothetical protein